MAPPVYLLGVIVHKVAKEMIGFEKSFGTIKKRRSYET